MAGLLWRSRQREEGYEVSGRRRVRVETTINTDCCRPEVYGVKMGKRVGILLMRHLLEAVRQRRVEVADSEPYWLAPEQYREHGDGGMEFLPSEAREFMAYVREQSFCPVGIVVLDEEGGCRTFVDERVIPEGDREVALRVFHTHAYFWFVHRLSSEKEQA